MSRNVSNIESDEIEMEPVGPRSTSMPRKAKEGPDPHQGWFKRELGKLAKFITPVDEWVGKSFVGRLFRLKGSGTVSITTLKYQGQEHLT